MYVKGSHRWERNFRPNWFVSQLSMPKPSRNCVRGAKGVSIEGSFFWFNQNFAYFP